MQIVVLGMHRSGTSAVTRIINMMGAYVGTEATSSGFDNPMGHWERLDLVEANKKVMKAAGAEWNQVGGYSESNLNKEALAEFEQDAKAMLAQLDAHRPWVIKDPRLCLLLPLWRPLLEKPVCVIVHRHPIQVAQSLKTRNGFPIVVGINLWEKYNISALQVSQNLPRIFVSYEQLMANPTEAIKQLHQDLETNGVEGLHPPDDEELSQFLDEKLFHERGGEELQSGYLNEWQKGLFDQFATGASSHAQATLSPGCVETLGIYDNMETGKVAVEVSRREADYHKTAFDDLNEQTEALKVELQDYSKHLDIARKEIERQRIQMEMLVMTHPNRLNTLFRYPLKILVLFLASGPLGFIREYRKYRSEAAEIRSTQ